MSACKFIASDMHLVEFAPSRKYPLHIDLSNGTLDDGGADDNYFLISFENVARYTNRKYGVYLEWNYTEGRAKKIIEYIKAALQETEVIEFWNVWLIDYYELEDRPFIHRKTIAIGELTVEHIKEMDNAIIWNTSDKMYPDRPSFYCLTITR